MPVRYVDQVQKLNICSMMAAALKAGPREQYTVCQDASGWHSVATARPGDEIIARIRLNRPPAKGASPPWGALVTLSVVGADGRCREQGLWLVATPTRLGRWRWTARCPYSQQPAQTLYFAMDVEQFVSRQTAGLKYRRTPRKVRNCHARVLAIMRELEATHSGPAIPKPIWMAEALYQDLMQELVEMDIRRMCAALKRPQPRFWDEPFDYANAKPERVNYPPSTVLFYAKKGVRQLKAKYRKRYGLPAAAA
jgi:hypothetical protein